MTTMNEQKATAEAPVAPVTNLAVLPPAQRAVVALGSTAVEADLRELVKQSADVVAVIDPAGREQAHRMGMNLKNARVAIGHKVEDVTEDAKKFGKAVREEAARLVDIISPEEDRIFKLRDDFDAKVRAAKEEAERKERERIAGIERAMAAMRALVPESVGKPAAFIGGMCDAHRDDEPTADVFNEYLPRAIEVHAEVLAQLEAAMAAQQGVEAEAERVRAEAAAEAARVAEQAEQNRIAAEKLAAERAEMEAEKARIAAESAERERVAALARMNEEKAAADRLALQQAEIDRAAAELKRQKDEFEAKQRLQEQADEDERRKKELAAEQEAVNAMQPQLPGVEIIEETDLEPFMPKSDHNLRVMIDRSTHGMTGTVALAHGAPDIVEDRPAYVVDAPVMLPLAVAYDEIADILIVDGVSYAGSMFRDIHASLMAQQHKFVPPALAVRDDGVIVVAG